MRLLLISTYYYPYCSGVTEYVRRIGEALVSKGHAVTVLTSRHDRSLKEQEDVNGVKVVRSPVLFSFDKGVMMPKFVFTALGLAKKHDVVNLHLPMMDAGLIALGVDRSKLVTTYHCDLVLRGNLVSRTLEKLYYMLARVAVMRSRLVVAYTEDYARHSSLLKRFMRKVVIVAPPIDESHFVWKRESLRREFRLGKERRVVGFAGRFVREKGLPFLLEAVPEVVKKHPGTVFLLAGEHKGVAGGSVIRQLRNSLGEHRNSIILLGNLSYETLPEFYSACDVLVLPSVERLEAFGMVQVEAMLCGTPVVTTNLPGVRIPVLKTGMGRLVRPGSSRELAAAISEVLSRRRKYIVPRRRVVSWLNPGETVRFYESMLKKYG